MVKENPRIMYGVIITVYVDHQTKNLRSFRSNRNKKQREWIIGRTRKRETGKRSGYDRRANLLAYTRQMREQNLAGDSKHDDGVSENKHEQQKWKKKKRWIRRMMSKFRLPFRRKNKAWRYSQFVPEGEEAKSKPFNSDIWKKLKHLIGGLSSGCVRSRRDS